VVAAIAVLVAAATAFAAVEELVVAVSLALGEVILPCKFFPSMPS
jgi:hypothetical protein